MICKQIIIYINYGRTIGSYFSSCNKIIKADLKKQPHVVMLDIEQEAKDNGVPRSANVILLGAAQKALGIEYNKLEDAIRRVFGRKGEAIVEANIKALAIGATNS